MPGYTPNIFKAQGVLATIEPPVGDHQNVEGSFMEGIGIPFSVVFSGD